MMARAWATDLPCCLASYSAFLVRGVLICDIRRSDETVPGPPPSFLSMI